MKALNTPTPRWPWIVYQDGLDLVCSDVNATCFGGADDKEDNGLTASGIDTVRFPWIAGVSLPQNGFHFPEVKSADWHRKQDGAPFPRLPFGIMVQITTVNGVDIPDLTFQLMERGPAAGTGNAIDFSVAAARMINPRATANNFKARVGFRVLGGAKYLR